MELHNSAKGIKSNNPKGGWYWSSSLLLSFFSSLAVDAIAFNAICSIPFLNRCSVPFKCSKAMSRAALKSEINGIFRDHLAMLYTFGWVCGSENGIFHFYLCPENVALLVGDPLLLADGTLHCGMYPAGKVAISLQVYTYSPPGSPGVTILSASSVRTLKHSRPPDLKSSSNVSLPFAWITGPATDPSSLICVLLIRVPKVIR